MWGLELGAKGSLKGSMRFGLGMRGVEMEVRLSGLRWDGFIHDVEVGWGWGSRIG